MKLVEAFKNPVTRPRAIIWTGTVLSALCLVLVVMFFATTSYWFCAEICHKVQDDSINTYTRSTHSKVSCVSCHMPANADVITYTIHKVEALAELPMTVLGTYEIPLNGSDEVAMNGYVFPSTQCTQCHDTSKRNITTTKGIIIDHEVHAEKNFACTVCHNRIAHNEEGYTFVNKDPKTGKLNTGHSNFMKMTGCYRCHRLADDGIEPSSPYTASGECKVCHSAGFDLKPESHKAKNFVADIHGKLAAEEAARSEEAIKEYGDEKAPEKSVKTTEGNAVKDVPNMKEINECYTCHTKKYCQDCHGGVTMPHPEGFLKNHSKEANANTAACKKCHGQNACTECHHSNPNVKGYTFNKSESWIKQHPVATHKVGAAACFECHESTYCAHCHVTGSPN